MEDTPEKVIAIHVIKKFPHFMQYILQKSVTLSFSLLNRTMWLSLILSLRRGWQLAAHKPNAAF